MKKHLRNISTALLAALFFVAASGYNHAHYCCDMCAEHGMRMFTNVSCHDVHQHHSSHEHTTAHCCEHRTEQQGNSLDKSHNCCSMERITVDESCIQKNEFAFSTHTHIHTAHCPCCCQRVAPLHESHNLEPTDHTPPLIVECRARLSIISVLLI